MWIYSFLNEWFAPFSQARLGSSSLYSYSAWAHLNLTISTSVLQVPFHWVLSCPRHMRVSAGSACCSSLFSHAWPTVYTWKKINGENKVLARKIGERIMLDLCPEYNKTFFFLFCIDIGIPPPFKNGRDILHLDCRLNSLNLPFVIVKTTCMFPGVSYACAQILPWPGIIS